MFSFWNVLVSLLALENWEGGHAWLAGYLAASPALPALSWMTVSTARQQLTSQGASQGLSFTGWQLLPTVPKCLPTSEPAMSVSLPTYPYIHNVQRPKVNIRRHILLLQTSSILNVRVGRDLRNSSSVFYNLSSRKKKKLWNLSVQK